MSSHLILLVIDFLQLVLFFNDTPTIEIYTLSLHDALPISPGCRALRGPGARAARCEVRRRRWCATGRDRKSTRLNSSHANISYAVFCLKKKKTIMYYKPITLYKISTNKR